jgi:predicted  nucleic acid-binding Zn-ribbon protein
MATVTATLRECHRLRKHLKNIQEEIDRGPRVLKAHQTRLAQEEQAHKDHHEAIKKLKLRQKDDEGTLKQTEARLAKLEDQLTGIVNSKEYDAKQSEIRQAREKRGALEDAILATMTELEEKTNQIPDVEKQWADAQAEFARSQEEAKERLVQLQEEQVAAREELARQEAALPPAMKPKYDYLVKNHGPDAMAAVKDKTCQGCRTVLTQQRMLDLQSGTFFQCPTCGKMLYPAE